MAGYFNFNPALFLSDSYQLACDVFWIMTAPDANQTVSNHAEQASLDLSLSVSPERFQKPFEISSETKKTIEKINNVISKIILISNYLKRGCWYFAGFSVVCFLFTRIFTFVVAICYLIASSFFATLGGDFSNIETFSSQMRCKFTKMQEDLGIIDRRKFIEDNNARAMLTHRNIEYIRTDIAQLKTSLYILNYFLSWSLLDDIDTRLENLEVKVDAYCSTNLIVRPPTF